MTVLEELRQIERPPFHIRLLNNGDFLYNIATYVLSPFLLDPRILRLPLMFAILQF